MGSDTGRTANLPGGRFLIERELGRGGMATVYLAQDLQHGRQVAIKVLRPDVAASVGAERFLREISTAARLQHPHILALHDSGDAEGQLYYVMPYVAGESLRDRLDRERQLPLDEALRITAQVASALAYAHAHDVVHRDIKPENILFAGGGEGERGHVLVTDFGIARAISSSGSETLTNAGIAVGTPSYMSPEQATADHAIDGRTDTYALGCVLYEMLAGHPPFLGTTVQEILARHSLDAVPPLRTIRPDLPEFVERAVGKALAKSPADRYATTSAFNAALAPAIAPPSTGRQARRRLLAGAAAGATLLAGYVLIRPGRPSRESGVNEAAESAPSIAVLPFTNIGGDPTNEPFSDGMADDLATALRKVEGLSVMARASAFSLRGKGLGSREIGRRLEVRYILQGSVQRGDTRRRVRADLMDVTTGREVWSDYFDHDALNRDVFTVQDSITRSILRQLLPHISRAAMASSVKRPTESPEAHDLYQLGRFFFERRDSASLTRAQNYFERAIRSDSSFALAYAGLSDAYSHQSVFGYAPPSANFPKAREYASRALDLDSTLVEAHSSAAFIALFYDWDWSAAGRAFDKALRLNPRYAPAHLFRAWYLMATDSVPEAIEEGRLAVQLDPFSSVNNTRLVTFLFYGRRYPEALVQARRTFDLDSNFIGVRPEVAWVYVRLGRCAEALAELARAPGQHLRGVPGYVYARCDRRAQAQSELARLRAQATEGKYVSHYGLAVIEAGLGNTARAFAELDSAYAERAWTMFMLRREPAFDGLRSDPRFTVLQKKVGLAP